MFWNKQSKVSKAVLGLILLDLKHWIQPVVYQTTLACIWVVCYSVVGLL